jgi:hypothetical protein
MKRPWIIYNWWWYMLNPEFFLGLFFDAEDEGRIFLKNVIWFSTDSLSNYLPTSFLISAQWVGHLGWGISPSQSRYLHTEQHRHRMNAHNTDIHASIGIRTHDPSVGGGEDGSCLRLRGHCDRPFNGLHGVKFRRLELVRMIHSLALPSGGII